MLYDEYKGGIRLKPIIIQYYKTLTMQHEIYKSLYMLHWSFISVSVSERFSRKR